MYYQHKDMHQAVKSKKSGENKKAQAPWQKIEGLISTTRATKSKSRRAGLLGNPFEKPVNRIGKNLGRS